MKPAMTKLSATVAAGDAAGGGHVKAIIDRVMPLEKLREAFDLIGDGAVKGKIVIDPTLEAV